MAELTLTIEGMSCGHCVMSVKKAIDALEGINSSDVSIGTARVDYDESKTNMDEIAKAVQNSGYKVAG